MQQLNNLERRNQESYPQESYPQESYPQEYYPQESYPQESLSFKIRRDFRIQTDVMKWIVMNHVLSVFDSLYGQTFNLSHIQFCPKFPSRFLRPAYPFFLE